MDQKFLNTVSEVLKVEFGILKADSTPETIKEWDSLSHWLLIGKLEDAYKVEFTMDESTEFQNLGDIYEVLKRKLS